MEIAGGNIDSFDTALDQHTKASDAAGKMGQKLIGCANLLQASCRQIMTGIDSSPTTQPAAPTNPAAAEIARAVSETRDDLTQLSTGFTVARLKAGIVRYQGDALRNQTLASLYEVEVRRQSFASDRRRLRSKQFFYGMLAAQAGVTIATLSLAVKRKSLLWSLAAAAGLFAVGFGAYIYLFI
jgi:hypothetical protein